MKNTLKMIGISALVAVIGLTMAACGGSSGGGSGPSAAVQKFFDAAQKNDTKAMEQVATEETIALMAMFGEKTQGSLSEYGKITTMEETIDGDTATVKTTFGNGETDDIKLVKVDGKWKVSAGK